MTILDFACLHVVLKDKSDNNFCFCFFAFVSHSFNTQIVIIYILPCIQIHSHVRLFAKVSIGCGVTHLMFAACAPVTHFRPVFAKYLTTQVHRMIFVSRITSPYLPHQGFSTIEQHISFTMFELKGVCCFQLAHILLEATATYMNECICTSLLSKI